MPDRPPRSHEFTEEPRPPRRRESWRWRLGQLVRMRPSEWVLIMRMLVMLRRLLRLQNRLPLPELLQRFEPRQRRPEVVEPRRLAWLTTVFLRRFFEHSFCMKRSILLYHFLREWGYPARIHFGVVRRNDKLDGHAWVEVYGRPFAEAHHPGRSFRVTYVYPPVSDDPPAAA